MKVGFDYMSHVHLNYYRQIRLLKSKLILYSNVYFTVNVKKQNSEEDY